MPGEPRVPRDARVDDRRGARADGQRDSRHPDHRLHPARRRWLHAGRHAAPRAGHESHDDGARERPGVRRRRPCARVGAVRSRPPETRAAGRPRQPAPPPDGPAGGKRSPDQSGRPHLISYRYAPQSPPRASRTTRSSCPLPLRRGADSARELSLDRVPRVHEARLGHRAGRARGRRRWSSWRSWRGCSRCACRTA